MDLNLDERLGDSLGQALGVPGTADEMSLARTDREQLGKQLMRSLTRGGSTPPLLSPADVYRVVPRRTWIRRKAEGGLTGSEFDGLYRLLRLRVLADLVFGDTTRAQAWLNGPKTRLGGATPMDFAADTLGFEAVQNWLFEIDQGYFS